MKRFFQGLCFLLCFFPIVSLQADYTGDCIGFEPEGKLYFDTSELEIADNVVYVHLEDTWIEASVIRTDQQGIYIFETDIIDSGINKEAEKRWKCPYCHHYWPYGQKCQNPNCPTNQW